MNKKIFNFEEIKRALFNLFGRETRKQEEERVEQAKKEVAEKKTAFIAYLQLLDSLALVNEYITMKTGNKPGDLPLIIVCFKELKRLFDSGERTLENEELVEICERIGKVGKHLDSQFLNLIVEQCLENNVAAFILTTSTEDSIQIWRNRQDSNTKLPVLFANTKLKKEVINNFLKENERNLHTIQKSLFNGIKKEFKTQIFLGIIETLLFSYRLTWDEEILEKLIKNIQVLFAFGVDCLPQIRKKNDLEILGKCLMDVASNLKYDDDIDVWEDKTSINKIKTILEENKMKKIII